MAHEMLQEFNKLSKELIWRSASPKRRRWRVLACPKQRGGRWQRTERNRLSCPSGQANMRHNLREKACWRAAEWRKFYSITDAVKASNKTVSETSMLLCWKKLCTEAKHGDRRRYCYGNVTPSDELRAEHQPCPWKKTKSTRQDMLPALLTIERSPAWPSSIG